MIRMIRMILFAVILGATAGLLGPALAAPACYDVSKQEPSRLTGLLTHRIFAGPPNFEDVQKGDAPEPFYVLRLASPICLTGDDGYTDPETRFDEVQLVTDAAVAGPMARLRDKTVTVELYDQTPAMTAHHHRPLVAWVKAVAPLRDPTALYGTSATVIQAFYGALQAGDGAAAAAFVVPEKTREGAFSPQALTRFYGSLAEPIRLTDIEPIGDNRYAVRYAFRSATGSCDGAATITTTRRGERDFILSIAAKNGC